MKIAALPKWQFAAIMQLKVLIPIEYLLGCKLDTLRCNNHPFIVASKECKMGAFDFRE